MVQNVSSNEVIGIILDLFSKGFVFSITYHWSIGRNSFNIFNDNERAISR